MPRVLLIEDEITLCESLVALLNAEGFDTVGVSDGLEAVRLLEQHDLPDIVVSDISMPELDGYAVLKILRSDPATIDIPLIFMTAKTQRRDIRYGMELGAADYLTKPFSPDELVNAVRAQLAKKEQWIEKFETQMNELCHNIIYSLPHELRTPLVGIDGFANLLKLNHESATPEEILHAADTILSSSNRLSHLIENYLVYAQLELIGHDPIKIAELRQHNVESASHVVQEAAVTTAGGFQRRGDLQLDLQDASVQIMHNDLEKTVTEIINNAFKFSTSRTPVVVRSRVHDQRWRLTVQDYGRGMTAKQINRVGAYMQFDRQLYEQQGLGLGLTLARRLVEMYSGELRIHSIHGQETTVTLDIPVYSGRPTS